jgi:hypothetical protein
VIDLILVIGKKLPNTGYICELLSFEEKLGDENVPNRRIIKDFTTLTKLLANYLEIPSLKVQFFPMRHDKGRKIDGVTIDWLEGSFRIKTLLSNEWKSDNGQRPRTLVSIGRRVPKFTFGSLWNILECPMQYSNIPKWLLGIWKKIRANPLIICNELQHKYIPQPIFP